MRRAVDQYYYGMYSDIQDATVQTILDAVVAELQRNPERCVCHNSHQLTPIAECTFADATGRQTL